MREQKIPARCRNLHRAASVSRNFDIPIRWPKWSPKSPWGSPNFSKVKKWILQYAFPFVVEHNQCWLFLYFLHVYCWIFLIMWFQEFCNSYKKFPEFSCKFVKYLKTYKSNFNLFYSIHVHFKNSLIVTLMWIM